MLKSQGTMSAPESKPPRRLLLSAETRDLCRRVGVRLDGKVLRNVIEYDADKGMAVLRVMSGFGRFAKPTRRLVKGAVEPFWR